MDDRSGQTWKAVTPAAGGLVRGVRTPTLAARLDAWLADARVEGSADARARERWLHAAAEADATFSGVLLDLAERGAPVVVTMAGGRRHHGCVEVIGADFAALRTATGAEVLLTLASISSARISPSSDPALGERVVTTELRLQDVLQELASERARVLLIMADGIESMAGELRSVGHDVITVRTDAEPSATAYVRAAALAEVTLS